ncbi:MAG: class I SAM-dependent methyltransferase [Thermodesulforhabdaceae bacterium]
MKGNRSKKEFFDKEALVWEEKHYPSEVRQRLEDLIKSEFFIAPGTYVLDVGTGTGILIPYLVKFLGSLGLICSLDLSFPMVREAKRKLSRSQDGVLCADIHHLPFRSEIFDQVICFAAFPHFDDPKRAMEEMSRVTKRGGRLVIAHLLSREELARHHASRNEVSDDLLPNDETFHRLAEAVGLQIEKIDDRPGRFVLRARKRY